MTERCPHCGERLVESNGTAWCDKGDHPLFKIPLKADGLKRNEVLSFDDGLLTVKVSGHGAGDGWASLAFKEQQFELDADGYQVVEIPPSELRALRDFLNRVIPVDAHETRIRELTEQRDEAVRMRQHWYKEAQRALSGTVAQGPAKRLEDAIRTAETMLSEHIEEFHDFDYEAHQVPMELQQLRNIQYHLLGTLVEIAEAEETAQPPAAPVAPERGWLKPALDKAEQSASEMPDWMRREPAAPVETEDNCACGGGDASGHDSMCPERSSAAAPVETDADLPTYQEVRGILPRSSAEPEGQAANKPAIDPKQIKAIDDFLADGERDRGYRAFAMMRHLWPRLREMALGVEGSK